eukprot:29904_1
MGACASAIISQIETHCLQPKCIIHGYEIFRTLQKSTGNISQTVEAYDPKTQKKLALQILPKHRPINSILFTHYVKILSTLQHENIVQLHNSTEDDSYWYISTILCEGGYLLDYIIDSKTQITETFIISNIIQPILKTIKYIHSKNMVHRNLSLENIMFETNTFNSKIKIIGIGYIQIIDENQEYNKNIMELTRFMAPELIAHQDQVEGKMLKTANIWSIGILCYILLTGSYPFNDSHEVKFSPEIYLSCSAKKLLNNLLINDPNKRWSLNQAINFIQVNNFHITCLSKSIIKSLCKLNFEMKLKYFVKQYISVSVPLSENDIKHHFERLSPNKDGLLNQEKLEIMMEYLGFPCCTCSQVANTILEGIGKLFIDFAEFKLVWDRILLSRNDELWNGMFDVFDVKCDGNIDFMNVLSVLCIDECVLKELMEREWKDEKLKIETISYWSEFDIFEIKRIGAIYIGDLIQIVLKYAMIWDMTVLISYDQFSKLVDKWIPQYVLPKLNIMINLN